MAAIIGLHQLLTSMGLIMAFILFVYMSIISKNPDLPRWKSLKFGLSIVTIIWLIPEVAANFLPEFAPYPISEGGDYGGMDTAHFGVGVWVHATAMVVFSTYILLRARGLLKG